ncbi:MAG: type II toxin-antitoxin system HicA family toxin [Selenomonadaceae bacterium]|nr:type II toxin-antitoxin system HicA family toxin [Selenomonadaceae bacterium]
MKRSELLKILRRYGCYFLENASNHEKWVNTKGEKFSVPRHSAKDLPKYLVEDIFKQAGIK